MGLEELLESERFEQYQREVATNTYSFDRVFAGACGWRASLRCSWEILDEGIVGSTRGRSLPATASWRRSPASPAARPCTALPAARCTPSCPLPAA